MIFDPNNKDTWPPDGEDVLLLVRTGAYSFRSEENYTVVASISAYINICNEVYFSVDIAGVAGPEWELDFEIEGIIAWKHIPAWEDEISSLKG